MELKGSMLRGQIFIAGAIVILVLIAVAMISLKYESPGYDRFLFRNADNLDKEFRFSASIDNLGQFMEYVNNNMHGFRAFYIITDSKTIIGNYLGEKTVFTIATDGFSQSFDLGNGQKAEMDKSFTRFNVSYTIDGVANSEEIAVKDQTVFIDYMIKDRDFARKKVIYYTQTQ